MDQDLDYSDLIEKKPKGKKQKPAKTPGQGGRKSLLPILILLLLLAALGGGGYFLWSRPEILASLMAQFRPAPVQETVETATTPEPTLATVVAAVTINNEVTAAPTELPPTEIPVEAPPEALLPLPDYGHLLQSSNQPGDQETRAVKLASNTAVREPYSWEYLEFEPGTLVKDVERYYIGLLNKEMGLLMTFNEKYPASTLAIFKFKQDTRRVTIQFFEGSEDRLPCAFLFYEGW